MVFTLGLAVLTALSRHDHMTAAGLALLELAGVLGTPDLLKGSGLTAAISDRWVVWLLVFGAASVITGVAFLDAGSLTLARILLQTGLLVCSGDVLLAVASYATSGTGWGASASQNTLERWGEWLFRRRTRWRIAAALFLVGTLLQFVPLVQA